MEQHVDDDHQRKSHPAHHGPNEDNIKLYHEPDDDEEEDEDDVTVQTDTVDKYQDEIVDAGRHPHYQSQLYRAKENQPTTDAVPDEIKRATDHWNRLTESLMLNDRHHHNRPPHRQDEQDEPAAADDDAAAAVVDDDVNTDDDDDDDDDDLEEDDDTTFDEDDQNNHHRDDIHAETAHTDDTTTLKANPSLVKTTVPPLMSQIPPAIATEYEPPPPPPLRGGGGEKIFISSEEELSKYGNRVQTPPLYVPSPNRVQRQTTPQTPVLTSSESAEPPRLPSQALPSTSISRSCTKATTLYVLQAHRLNISGQGNPLKGKLTNCHYSGCER